jgi:ATP synthase protein I
METPDRDPDGERRRLDDLDARLKKARTPEVKPSQDVRVSHRETGVAYRVLVDMIAGLLVGGFIGYWLDRWQGWAPWSLVGGLIVGFAAGVNNAWRAIRVYSEQANAGRTDGGENRLP